MGERCGFSWLKTAWEEDLWVARGGCWTCLSQALGSVSTSRLAPCAWLQRWGGWERMLSPASVSPLRMQQRKPLGHLKGTRRGCWALLPAPGGMFWPAALPAGVASYQKGSWQGGKSILSRLKPSDLCQGFGLDFYYLSQLSLLCESKQGHGGYLAISGLSHLLQGGQYNL